jgi:hypothetical protein
MSSCQAKILRIAGKKNQSCDFSFDKCCCSSTNFCFSPVDLTNFARFLDKKFTKLEEKNPDPQERKKSKLLSEKSGSYMAIFSCIF